MLTWRFGSAVGEPSGPPSQSDLVSCLHGDPNQQTVSVHNKRLPSGPAGNETWQSKSPLIYTGWWCNNHLEKYEFVNGKDDILYIMEHKIHV